MAQIVQPVADAHRIAGDPPGPRHRGRMRGQCRVTGAGEQPAVGIVAGPEAPHMFGQQGDETIRDVHERSFLPGRTFTGPGDFNYQFQKWLQIVNARRQSLPEVARLLRLHWEPLP